MTKKFVQIGLILAFILTSAGCNGCGGGNKDTKKPKEFTLKVWNLFDDEDTFEPILKDWKKDHSNIKIEYTQKEEEEYENRLVNALASDSGPDIFVIRSDWLPKHKDKIVEAPEKVIKPENVESNFVPIVYQDFVSDNKVWGLPIAIDSLALYVNDKMLSESRVKVPTTWNDFIDASKKLTKKEGTKVTQAGIAMGNASNVANSVDILTLLMLQNIFNSNGAMVSADKKSATFQLPTTSEAGGQYYPGKEALEFYTSFARPSKETYSWNSSFQTSVKTFTAGKAAMMIDYSYQTSYIKNQSPTLSYTIKIVPQIKGAEKTVNFGRYWSFVVSKKSQFQEDAWDFIKFITSEQSQDKYNISTNRPPSSKKNSKQQQGLSLYGAFNKQSDTMQSWYKGKEPEKVDQNFIDMINSVVNQNTPTQTAIDTAAASVTKLLQNE